MQKKWYNNRRERPPDRGRQTCPAGAAEEMQRAQRPFWKEDRRMDLQNMDLKGGSLQISTEVIGKIARCAALETKV